MRASVRTLYSFSEWCGDAVDMSGLFCALLSVWLVLAH
jgi:hypothetical protein